MPERILGKAVFTVRHPEKGWPQEKATITLITAEVTKSTIRLRYTGQNAIATVDNNTAHHITYVTRKAVLRLIIAMSHHSDITKENDIIRRIRKSFYQTVTLDGGIEVTTRSITAAGRTINI